MFTPLTTASMVRRGMIAVGENPVQVTTQEVAATAALELINVGFVARCEDLQLLTHDQLSALIVAAQHVVGADRAWKPLFPGFPAQVLAASDSDLITSAIAHYFTAGLWRPVDTSAFQRGELADVDWAKNRRTLHTAVIHTGLIRAQWSKAVAMSVGDREFVTDVARALGVDLVEVLKGSRFRNGENFAAALACLRELGVDVARVLTVGLNHSRTVDDILRTVLVCFCAEKKRAFDLTRPLRTQLPLAQIPRPARREILSVLSLIDDPRALDRAIHRRDMWRCVMKKIHPFELKESVGCEEFMDVVFENSQYRSFNSRVEQLLAAGDVIAAANLLVVEPGGLVRRLRHLVRLAGNPQLKGWESAAQAIIFALAEAGPNVRLTTLISAFNGLSNHGAAVKLRKLRRRFHIVDVLPEEDLDSGLVSQVLEALETAIMARLTLAPAPEKTVATGSTVPVELVRRHASSSMSDIWPGERISLGDIGDHAVLRAFVHWFGEDVDLGVSFTDAEFSEQLGHLDYTTMNTSRLRRSVVHSGDVVRAPRPNGGCEFIDIRMGNGAWTWEKLHLKSLNMQLPSARYAIVSVASFSGAPLSTLDTIAGVMIRNDEMAGCVFEPRTVETASRLHIDSTSAVPFIVDLHTAELIWLDSSLGTLEGKLNLENSDVVRLARAEMEALSQRLTNGRLLELWALAHGMDTTPEPAENAGKDQVTRLLSAC